MMKTKDYASRHKLCAPHVPEFDTRYRYYYPIQKVTLESIQSTSEEPNTVLMRTVYCHEIAAEE